MAFNESITYDGPVEADDPGTPNNANSFYLQKGSGTTDRPAAGNEGVLYYDRLNKRLYFDTGSAWEEIQFSHGRLSGIGRNDHHPESHSLQSHTGTLSANQIEGAGGFLVGQALWYFGANTPEGFLECNGDLVSRSTYSDLFNIIGTTYNTGGESSSQFRLPNLQRRVMMGRGGSKPQYSTGPGTNLGNVGGGERTPLFVGSHSHSVPAVTVGNHNHSGSVSISVSGHSHNVSVSVPNHLHSVSTSSHTHSATVSNHTHTAPISLSLPAHTHTSTDLFRGNTNSWSFTAFTGNRRPTSLSGYSLSHFTIVVPSTLSSVQRTSSSGGGASGSSNITTNAAGAQTITTGSGGSTGSRNSGSAGAGTATGTTSSAGSASGSSNITTNNTSISVPSHNTDAEGQASNVMNNNVQPSIVVRCLIKT